MKQFPKVALDMFVIQLIWALGFLGIMLIIHLIKIFIGDNQETFYASIFVACNIFMLVIGIISIYFIPHYVGNGVTRKDYFKGELLASIGLSIVIPIITFCISIVVQFVIKSITQIEFQNPDFNSAIDMDNGHFIGDVVQSVILTPFIDPQDNLVLSIGIFSLNIFIFYLAGWLIGASFYRFDAGTGIGFILIALIVITIEQALLRISLELPVASWFQSLEFLPLAVTGFGIFIITILSIWMIRQLTKRVSIKM